MRGRPTANRGRPAMSRLSIRKVPLPTHIVAVRVEGKNQMFQFPTKKDAQSFIKEIKGKGIKYSYSTGK